MLARWSEHEARVALHEWQISGQSIERFASQRGLVPQRIRWWKKKLEDAPVPQLLPIQLDDVYSIQLVDGHLVCAREVA